MIEKTIQLYTYEELNDDVKTKLFYKWNINECYIYNDDIISDANKTLEKFCNYFDVGTSYIHYSSVYTSDFKFYVKTECAHNVDCINSPERLRKYIINNYVQYYEKGKYYSTAGRWENGKYTYKSRYSKIIKTRDCPLTGIIYDYYILDPLYDFIDGKTEYKCYYDLIHACISSYLKNVDSDIEYIASRDYFEEVIQDGFLYNDTLFFSDGTVYQEV